LFYIFLSGKVMSAAKVTKLFKANSVIAKASEAALYGLTLAPWHFDGNNKTEAFVVIVPNWLR
jgi:hypothetical protein